MTEIVPVYILCGWIWGVKAYTPKDDALECSYGKEWSKGVFKLFFEPYSFILPNYGSTLAFVFLFSGL